jgi:hypothetical protein
MERIWEPIARSRIAVTEFNDTLLAILSQLSEACISHHLFGPDRQPWQLDSQSTRTHRKTMLLSY